MKKTTVIFVAVASILLTSCGGSGWSCKKRYCDTDSAKESLQINKTQQIELNSEIACR